MSLPARVLRTVRKHRMIPEGGRVLAAVSGGSDSVALARLLRELEEAGGISLAGIAHLNHGLRPGASADEEFCRELAERLRVPFFVERVHIRKLAQREQRSIEDAARQARYEFFSRAREQVRADVVATGHTRDDQAETFLLRLLRGAGTRGLAGVRPYTGHVIRPLIDVRRDDLRRYLEALGQGYCEDETNRDTSIPRNRIRHDLIPYLEREFSPAIADVLAREADLARQDEDRLHNEAIDSAGLIVLKDSGGRTAALTPEQARARERGDCVETAVAVEIDAAGLVRLHPAVASRIARLALSILAPDRFVGFEHVDALLSLASASNGAVSLPGQQAVRRESRIELVREPFRGFANSFKVPLSIPGEVTLDAQGWAVSAHVVEAVAEQPEGERPAIRNTGALRERPLQVSVQANRLTLPLAVRSRREGDRLKPAGLAGRSKKLQDFLVDNKVAREQRDSLPLVVDGGDRIVWIVGHPVAEDFRVTEPAQGVILLKARRLGGQG